MAVDKRSNRGRVAGNDTPLTSIELFTGTGGLAEGLHKAGFRHLLAVELYHRACESLRINRAQDCKDLAAAAESIPTENDRWPLFEGKVQDVDFTPFEGKVDVLAGGVPCQPWSIAGKKEDIEEKIGGERNLWPEMFRVAHQTRPKAIIAENVIGLTRPSFKEYFEYIIDGLRAPHEQRVDGENWRHHHERLRKRLKANGIPDTDRYVVNPVPLNAADFGVPQLRKRLFIVAYRADLNVEWIPPSTTHSQSSLIRDLLNGEYWSRHGISPRQDLIESLTEMLPDGKEPWRTLRDGIEGLDEPELDRTPTEGPPHHVGWPGARRYRGHQPSDLDWPSKTIKAGVHGVAGGELAVIDRRGRYRYLTVREVARLMTFDDKWMLDGTRGPQMRQLGNAVPVDLAEAVGKSVRKQLRHEKETN
ncbi:DNA cytosine methyltransferase [Dactylosporangium sp. CA-139114]|uniref:DNA cytosine methyltransferase n=1 Tax=Dactylosporangium sp. CA-139114 TaxID=3239931 RepID=UPI003D97E062